MGTQVSGVMNKLIEKLSMQEGFQKVTKEYTAQYMIPGETTEDLHEILKRAPEPLLDWIWKQVGTGEDIPDRAQKEEALYQAIPDSMEEEFPFLTDMEITVLTEVATNQSVSEIEIMMAMEKLNSYGWVFIFQETEDGCCFAIPMEVKQMMQKLASDETKISLLKMYTGVRELLHICIDLYGVFTLEILYRVLHSISSGIVEEEKWKEEELSIRESIENWLEDLWTRENGWWRDGRYIIADKFQTKSEYREFLKNVESQEYYIPTREEYQQISIGVVDTKAPEYRSVKSALTGLLRDSQEAEIQMTELEELVSEDGKTAQQVMEVLYQNGLEFPTAKRAEAFENTLQVWIYKVRRWKNRGFTDEEMGKVLSLAAAQIQPIRKKIGRNDPCPCGSGKKYKKCCGR